MVTGIATYPCLRLAVPVLFVQGINFSIGLIIVLCQRCVLRTDKNLLYRTYNSIDDGSTKEADRAGAQVPVVLEKWACRILVQTLIPTSKALHDELSW